MTHPRKLVRDDVQARLQAVLSVPVYAGRARDLPRGTTEAVAVYVAEEQLSRPAAARGRPAGPITRKMRSRSSQSRRAPTRRSATGSTRYAGRSSWRWRIARTSSRKPSRSPCHPPTA